MRSVLLTVSNLNGLHGILVPKPVTAVDGRNDTVPLPGKPIMMEDNVVTPERGSSAMTYHVLLTASIRHGVHGKIVPQHVGPERRQGPGPLRKTLLMGELLVSPQQKPQIAMTDTVLLTASFLHGVHGEVVPQHVGPERR
jgi:hypothetical protein